MYKIITEDQSSCVQVSDKISRDNLHDKISLLRDNLEKLPLVIGVSIDIGEYDVCRLKIFDGTR
jgi:hypothetical protein